VTGDVWVVLPLACLISGAFAVYLIARFISGHNGHLAAFTTAILVVTLMTLGLLSHTTSAEHLPTWGRFEPGETFLRAEPSALVVANVAAGLGVMVACYSGHYIKLDRRYETYYPLLLLLVAGLIGMVMATDLFNLYMFCELMSITAYVLVGFRRRTHTAIEASFKYLMMGSVGTIISLLGISFIYRERGHLALVQAVDKLESWDHIGIGCIITGMGIKSALVPLHTWLPDAHGRAPSSISAMLSGIIVPSSLYTLLKVSLGLGLSPQILGTMLIVLSLLNMTLGNSMALVQTNTKRLLAYSTIAQVGYLMLAMGIGLRYNLVKAIQAGFFMILVQALAKGLAFLCKGISHFYLDATTINQLQGTAKRLPLVAVCFAVALGGLGAIPPLAGFTGKWLVVTNSLRSSAPLGYIGLVFFLLNSLMSLGYYLPLIGTLFSEPHIRHARRFYISYWMRVPLIVMGACVIAIGLYPDPWLAWTDQASTYLLELGK
jgi:proton-translocating NADH-quinone oxidoreductase chain N